MISKNNSQEKPNFNEQFNFEENWYLENLDFVDWCRYFYIIREVIDLKPRSILDIGSGNGIIKNCLKPIVDEYKVMDINAKLKPDYLNDIRNLKPELKEKFDCLIAADILEHIPFKDFKTALANLFIYLKNNGKALITIPHRADYFLWMTPTNIPHVFRMPTKFLSPATIYRYFKRKTWIDFYHLWEIGDGKVKRNEVEKMMKSAGFIIKKSGTLPYVDFYVLKRKN